MNIYEVAYLAHEEDQRDDDSCKMYLVRAFDFRSALEETVTNGIGHQNRNKRVAINVFELGPDFTAMVEIRPRILRGPYYAHVYNYGWKAWKRRLKDGEYIDEWVEYVPPSH